MYMRAQSLSYVLLFVTPRTVARQAPLSMGFLRQEYWSRLNKLERENFFLERQNTYIHIMKSLNLGVLKIVMSKCGFISVVLFLSKELLHEKHRQRFLLSNN